MNDENLQQCRRIGYEDRTGRVYGTLTVLRTVGSTRKRERIWEAVTAKGRTIYLRSSQLTRIAKRVERGRSPYRHDTLHGGVTDSEVSG